MRNLLVWISVFLLSVLWVTNVAASETRVFSMGQVGLFIHDNSNVVPFPGAIMNYGNEVVTELRVKDNEASFSAEARIPINSYMLGVNFNRPIYLFTPPVGFNLVRLTNTSDVYFGTELLGNNFAARVSLGRDGFTRDSISVGQPKVDESARYLEVAAGFSSENYDVGAALQLPSIKSETVMGGETLKDEWSGTGINLTGRYFYELNDQMQAVPVVTFGTTSTSQETDQIGTAPKINTDFSELSFNFGIGLHYQLNQDNLIILAIDPFGYYKRKREQTVDTTSLAVTNTTTTLPRLYLGVEAKIKNWVVGRIGANRAYQTYKTKTEPPQGNTVETTSEFSPYNVSFGLGIKLGKFLVDIDINDGLFFEGPNFISGQMRDLSNRVSISYLFANNGKDNR